MDPVEKIPVAVIGAGRMGLHHARIYDQLDQADLVAVVDSDPKRASQAAQAYGCRALTDVNELLRDFPALKAASIATPTAAHEAVAEPLLGRGVACLIEKPMAPSSAAARRIVDLAKSRRVLVQVGHTERFNPAVRSVAELGIRPRFIEVHRVSPMRFRSVDVGVVFDLMIHDLDIVLMLAQSPLREVRATGVSVLGEHEDVANARLEFADGCVANLTASRLALKTERKMRIFSETAYVTLDYASKRGLVIQRSDNNEALESLRKQLNEGADLADVDYTKLVQVRELAINDEEPLAAQLKNFLEAVAGRGTPAVDAQAGLAAVETAERVVTAIRSHRWI